MADSATAQDISLNYERLSSMEEPLATEIGDLTLTLTGLVDAPLTADFEADLLGNFEAVALIQLQNRWRVSLAYFGQYATDEALNAPPDDEDTDNVGLSAGSVWGTAVAGYVSGIVREGTRRGRGAGNALLAFDDALGGLAEWGGGYRGRFGHWVIGAAVDEDADFDLGPTFRRPMDVTDYRLSVRFGKGTHAAAGGSCDFDSNGAADAELSLAGNVVRVVMHPADQVQAFAALAAAGAARFGVSERTRIGDSTTQPTRPPK